MGFIPDSQAKNSEQESLQTDNKTWTGLSFCFLKIKELEISFSLKLKL